MYGYVPLPLPRPAPEGHSLEKWSSSPHLKHPNINNINKQVSNKAIVDIRLRLRCAMPPPCSRPTDCIAWASKFFRILIALAWRTEWSLLQQTRHCSVGCSKDCQCFWMVCCFIRLISGLWHCWAQNAYRCSAIQVRGHWRCTQLAQDLPIWTILRCTSDGCSKDCQCFWMACWTLQNCLLPLGICASV